MMLGAAAVGVHMAMTHAICLSMLSAYIPATEVPGLGRVSGTVWSFTDFVLGKLPVILSSPGCYASFDSQKPSGPHLVAPIPMQTVLKSCKWGLALGLFSKLEQANGSDPSCM